MPSYHQSYHDASGCVTKYIPWLLVSEGVPIRKKKRNLECLECSVTLLFFLCIFMRSTSQPLSSWINKVTLVWASHRESCQFYQ